MTNQFQLDAMLASRELKCQGLDFYIVSLKKEPLCASLKATVFLIAKATHVIVETLGKK